jgi:hypothetical protein
VQAQNVHATVSLAAVFVVCFNAAFLPDGSDERQRRGRIKAVGHWFESGRCVAPLTLAAQLTMGVPQHRSSENKHGFTFQCICIEIKPYIAYLDRMNFRVACPMISLPTRCHSQIS